jgi:hypothetical protein
MNEKSKNILSLILSLIALLISVLPCLLPYFMWRLVPKFLVLIGFLLHFGGPLGLAIALLSLFLVHRSQNRLLHKTVWFFSFCSIFWSAIWTVSSVIIFIQKYRGE